MSRGEKICIEGQDIVITGKLNGSVSVGSTVYFTYMGDDDANPMYTTVIELQTHHKQIDYAQDTFISLKLEGGAFFDIRIGTVLYTQDIPTKVLHDIYLYTLVQVYIKEKKLNLTKAEYDQLTLTDLAELRRLFRLYGSEKNNFDICENYNQSILNTLTQHMCQRILDSKEIYVVMNKKTGEPHLFNQIIENKNHQMYITFPNILLITKAYVYMWSLFFNQEEYNVIKIDNQADKNGILKLLSDSFYLNGVCGVSIIFTDFSIDANMLVECPIHTSSFSIQEAVMNPDLERWLLLEGQLGKDSVHKQTEKMYFTYIFKELVHARFLVPIKFNREIPLPNQQGKTVIEEDTIMTIAMLGNKTLCMFTDWKRLRKHYKEEDEWQGLVVTLSEIINEFDCVINPSENTNEIYINKQIYEQCIKQQVDEYKKYS